MAQVLRAEGYHAWTGILSAERFGVPQTRKRAFLIASLDGPVGEPLATHQRYVAPLRRDDIGAGLFDLPDPERIVARGEDNLLPWVSMAEALGWAVRADLWQLRSNARTNSAVRGADEPAPTITAGHDHNERVWVPTHLDVRQEGAVLRAVEDPSPTVTAAGLEKGRDIWVNQRPAPTIVGTRRSSEGMLVGRQLPAGEGTNVGGKNWVDERPATTVAGDPRIFTGPRNERNHDYQPGDGPVSQANDGHAVRVTMEQAACLQSFPSGYPWEAAGSRSAAFRCIGNAVPPPMAQAVLREAIGGSDHE